MILQLLGTLLLTAFNGAMSVESQRSSAPIKENTNNAIGTLYLNGGYVVKNVDTPQNVFFTESLDFDSFVFTYDSSTNFNYKLYCPDFNEDSNRLFSFKPVNTFELSYFKFGLDTITCTFTFADDENTYSFSVRPNQSYYYVEDNQTTNIDLSYMAVYFDYPCYVNQDLLTMFDSIFTSTLNSHYVRYHGWYSFYTPVRLHYKSFDLYTSLLVANSNYNLLEWVCGPSEPSERTIRVYNTYDNGTGVPTEPLYIYQFTNLWYSNIYFDNLFCNDLIYSELVYSGQFTYYAPDSEQYGLGDLFYNIADTPVIFITSLFSFELFGVQFYVAFMGIITAIAMIFIIRKIL